MIANDGTNNKGRYFDFMTTSAGAKAAGSKRDKRIYYGMENGLITVDVIKTRDLLFQSPLTGDDYYDYHNVNVA